MADSLAVDVRASLAWLYQETLDLSTVADASRLEYATSLLDDAESADPKRLWHDERTLAGSASEDLDLTALPRTMFGTSMNIELGNVRALMIVNVATGEESFLLVGGATSGAWYGPFAASNNKLYVAPESSVLLVNKQHGWPVGDSSGTKLRIANLGSDPATYRIVLVGQEGSAS